MSMEDTVEVIFVASPTRPGLVGGRGFDSLLCYWTATMNTASRAVAHYWPAVDTRTSTLGTGTKIPPLSLKEAFKDCEKEKRSKVILLPPL